ncbi:MAG TPA: gamma-glutamyltransferase [Anaerolineae bacterium]|nr:gamma-glutamyltransferase [Anaerolineae bacterium]
MTRGGFHSRRSAVLARHGMVATSQPLAAMAGLRVLMAGGNAADAAVATAAMLNVVEPMSTGIGGDCFALVYDRQSDEVTALNGSGRSPRAFMLEEAQRRGLRSIPLTGPLPVTVPGTASGWQALLDRFGTMTLAECLAPAIETAEQGFPVSERISGGWQRSTEKLSQDDEAARVYLPAPREGQIHRQPDLARTFRQVAEGGARAFYHGPIAERIAAAVQAKGGYLTAEDMADQEATWHAPISTTYRGIEVLEHPPNGQGLAALIALNIVEGYDVAGLDYFDPVRWHVMIEAMRLAMVDAGRYVADPALVDVPLEELLSKGYADLRRSEIHPNRALSRAIPGTPEHRDTVYLTTADAHGNAVSFINSLYYGFGSGIVAPGTGICLQNRGACFVLEPGHPNVLAGGKRPYHTIIPAMARRDGRLWLSFGVMGGFMQPQGHLQVIANMVDYGLDPQAALDAPRFRVDERGSAAVAIETGVPLKTRKALDGMGHKVDAETMFAPGFGGGQIIAIDPETGVLWGGSDPRKDGCAVGF